MNKNYYNEYLKGALDCMKGKPVKVDAGKRYNKGYSDQYIAEEVISARTDGRYGQSQHTRKGIPYSC